jgi:hypothetical protein
VKDQLLLSPTASFSTGSSDYIGSAVRASGGPVDSVIGASWPVDW